MPLKVACEIYKFNIENKPVWFGKLVESMEGVVSKNTISESLDTLTDWMIIKGHYGATGDGRASYLYEIDPDQVTMIKELYEKYWRK